MKYLVTIFFILSVLIISCGETSIKKPCTDVNCSNHGTCIVDSSTGVNIAVCECDDGYFEDGLNCKEITPCTDVNCSNHGLCKIDTSAEVERAYCECNDGYFEDGLNCNEKPASICLNNGSQKIVYEDITSQLGLKDKRMIGTNITVTDFDQDHWPDVVVSKGLKTRYDKTAPKYNYALFKNEKGNFRNYTWQSKLFKTQDGEDGRISSYVIFGDINNDGYPDAFNVAYIDSDADTRSDKSDIFINNGDTTFSIFQEQIFSPDITYNPASSAFFIDYDKDSSLDLFVSHHYSTYGILSSALTDTLHQGKGNGYFTDVTELMGLKTLPFSVEEAMNANTNTPSWGASACDLNNDGFEEILVSSYGRQDNLLFMYNNNKYDNLSIMSNFAYDDIENYLDNQFFACYCQYHPTIEECSNAQSPVISCSGLENNWNVGVDDKPFRLGGNTSNSLCADFDNDGDNDVLSIELAHWHIGQSSDKTQLLINDDFPNNPLTRLTEEESGITRTREGSWNDGDLGGVAEDLNNDGKMDIIITSSDYPGTTSLVYEQGADGKFTNITDDSGLKIPRAHGIALIDYDRDGDYDIMMGQSLMRWTASDEPNKPDDSYVHLFENKTGQDSNKIMIDIKGAGYAGKSNSDAIGAKIIVEAGGKKYTRSIQGGYGLFGIQKDPFIIIGIDNNCMADKITIQWPNQNHDETVFTEVPANYVLRIREGSSKIGYFTLEEYRK
jgi:hypothetical protein